MARKITNPELESIKRTSEKKKVTTKKSTASIKKPRKSTKAKTEGVEKVEEKEPEKEVAPEKTEKKLKSLPKEEDVKLDEKRWKSTYYDEEKEEAAKEEKPILTPSQYFEMVKDKMVSETSESIMNVYTATYNCLKRYVVTKQKVAAKDCYARCEALVKESKLLEHGITQWVDRHIIDTFIDDVADECVCIITMDEYPRPIPDEIIDKVMETSQIFDQFFILFTDYTGEERKKVAKEKRDKDPILFGNIFIDGKVSHKMYFIGDWEDEYCDLTMSQMISLMADKYEGEILQDITPVPSIEELEATLYGRKLNKTEE